MLKFDEKHKTHKQFLNYVSTKALPRAQVVKMNKSITVTWITKKFCNSFGKENYAINYKNFVMKFKLLCAINYKNSVMKFKPPGVINCKNLEI